MTEYEEFAAIIVKQDADELVRLSDVATVAVGAEDERTETRYNGKQAIGLGFRWISPFGPLRVDYGVNPNPKNGESFGNFNFSVGSAF